MLQQQQIQWTMGYGVTFRPYHTAVVRNQITGCLGTSLPTMFEEMSNSFDDLIGRPAGETQNWRQHGELLLIVNRIPSFQALQHHRYDDCKDVQSRLLWSRVG